MRYIISYVVSCFQIRNFVTSNNQIAKEEEQELVVSSFQIRNFVTSNNLTDSKALDLEL